MTKNAASWSRRLLCLRTAVCYFLRGSADAKVWFFCYCRSSRQAEKSSQISSARLARNRCSQLCLMQSLLNHLHMIGEFF